MTRSFLTAAIVACASVTVAGAQTQPGPVAPAQPATVAEPGGKSLSATMNVYVFPTTGQSAAQQGTDEAACYTWAVQNTGVDPFLLAKQAQAQQQQAAQAKKQAGQAGKGAGAAGAVGGAAVGALIGEIASDDAGKGAALGAGAGLLAGRAHRRQAQQQATQQAEKQAQQAQKVTAEQLENFKKAFSVCLEAKHYLVKY